MIRKNIIKNKNDKQRYFLNDSWRIEMQQLLELHFMEIIVVNTSAMSLHTLRWNRRIIY